MERAERELVLDQLAWNGADLLTGSGQGDFSWEDLGEIAPRSSGNQGQQRFGSLQRYLAASGTLGKIHDLQEDERRFQWLYALSPTERRRQRGIVDANRRCAGGTGQRRRRRQVPANATTPIAGVGSGDPRPSRVGSPRVVLLLPRRVGSAS